MDETRIYDFVKGGRVVRSKGIVGNCEKTTEKNKKKKKKTVKNIPINYHGKNYITEEIVGLQALSEK